MGQPPSKKYLKDYQPPNYWAKKIDLTFDLDEDSTIVTSEVSYFKNSDKPNQLLLAGKGLTLVSLEIDGKSLEISKLDYSKEQLLLKDLPAEFRLKLSCQIDPKNNTALEGLYMSGEKYCTQCEPEGFRRITYFLDRPDVMAEYQTTIRAVKQDFPVLLANGNLIEKKDLEGGRHQAIWHDPFPKPSYLFALVAGDLVAVTDQFITKSGRTIQIEIYVEAHNQDKCDFALQSVKQAMAWDEKIYNLEYDLDIFMIVAVGDFNMGAMENKGLNIFNAKYILASKETATDTDFENIQNVIGYENTHDQ